MTLFFLETALALMGPWGHGLMENNQNRGCYIIIGGSHSWLQSDLHYYFLLKKLYSIEEPIGIHLIF